MGSVIFMTIAFTVGAFLMGRRWERQNQEEKYDVPEEVLQYTCALWKKHPNVMNNLQGILSDYGNLMKEKNEAEEEKNTRIKSNEAYQKRENPNPPDRGDMFCVEGFKLWALLTHNYQMERSLLMDRELQYVCDKIAGYLDKTELDALFQINTSVCDDAADFLISLDSDVSKGMEEIERILKNSNSDGHNENKYKNVD